jgi:uncharacterized protein DUF3485
MSPLYLRVSLAALLLLGGWLSQSLLERHVTAAGPLPEVPLAQPLAELPRTLGDWQGVDRPIGDPKLQIGDERLSRTYVHKTRGQQISLWIVYSKEGEDRGHHPEVCMAVAGRAEDPTERAELPLAGHAAPIQQYRFGTPGQWTWVFYWHYTLMPAKAAQLSDLQRFYQRLHRRPSSATLEVFSEENTPDDVEFAREFVKLVDAAVQSQVGPTAVRGSQRKPVTIIRTQAPE